MRGGIEWEHRGQCCAARGILRSPVGQTDVSALQSSETKMKTATEHRAQTSAALAVRSMRPVDTSTDLFASNQIVT